MYPEGYKSSSFYQHHYAGKEYMFSGQLPSRKEVNFSISSILNTYSGHSYFQFNLFIRDGTHLSILREAGRKHIEVAQVVNDHIRYKPCFEHNRYGIATMDLFDLPEFIEKYQEEFSGC